MPDSPKTDRFWRMLAILLLLVVAANISLGYLRKMTPAPETPAMQVRQIVLAPNPKLDRILPAVDLNGVKFDQALNDLMHEADLNLVALWTPITRESFDEEMPVTLHLKNVSVATALDALLSVGDPNHRCGWDEEGGVVTVGPRDSLDRSRRVVRIYDVKHLIAANIPPRPDPSVFSQSGAMNSSGQSQQQWQSAPDEERLDAIRKIIVNNVQPESWVDNGGDVGFMTGFGDLLVITQTEQAHQRIAALLQAIDHR